MTARPRTPRWSTMALALLFAGSLVGYIDVRPTPTPTGYARPQARPTTTVPASSTTSTTARPRTAPTTTSTTQATVPPVGHSSTTSPAPTTTTTGTTATTTTTGPAGVPQLGAGTTSTTG